MSEGYPGFQPSRGRRRPPNGGLSCQQLAHPQQARVDRGGAFDLEGSDDRATVQPHSCLGRLKAPRVLLVITAGSREIRYWACPWQALAVSMLAAAGLVVGCTASHPAGSQPRPRSPTPSPAGASASPGSANVGRVVAQISVGNYPDRIVTGFGSLWTANLYSDSVSRVDPATRRVTATISVPNGPISLLAADGAMWSADWGGTTVTRIDPAANRVTGTIRVGSEPASLAIAGGVLWVFNQGDDTASVVNPRTLRVTRTVHIGIAAGNVVVHAGLLWVLDFQGGSRKLLALDPETGD